MANPANPMISFDGVEEIILSYRNYNGISGTQLVIQIDELEIIFYPNWDNEIPTKVRWSDKNVVDGEDEYESWLNKSDEFSLSLADLTQGSGPPY